MLTKDLRVTILQEMTGEEMFDCLEVYHKGSGWTQLNISRLKKNGLFVYRVSSDTMHISPDEVHKSAEHTIKRLPSLTHYHPDALLTAAERFMGHNAVTPLHVYPPRIIN